MLIEKPLALITCLLFSSSLTPTSINSYYLSKNVSSISQTNDPPFNLKEIEKQATKTPSGLKYIDLTLGTGDSPSRGKVIIIKYTLRLTNGKKVDSTDDRGEDFRFRLGLRQVVKGLEEGVGTMKVGGKRRLIIPSTLGYGEAGNGTTVPSGAILVFDVELVGVEL